MALDMTFWDHLCCAGYGVQARWDALVHHKLQGHDLAWRRRSPGDAWAGCFGDIVCETCNLAIWCRHSRLWMRLGIIVCGILGHPSWTHPERHAADEKTVPATDQVVCTRCMLWFNKAE